MPAYAATRRSFIQTTFLTGLVLGLTPVASFATTAPPSGPFKLPKLGYAYNALAPTIDAKTMEIHLTKHHQAYVDKLNAEVVKDSALKDKSLEEILANVTKYNKAVRNNAGGHWNHSFFWKLMAPAKERGEASAELKAAIDAKFGSMDKLIEIFDTAGTSQFGSGWVWLIKTPTGSLEIATSANQDNPLMDDAPIKGKPILANDVWEHAYYLTYQNRRADYLKNWWKVVNWKQVSENFKNA